MLVIPSIIKISIPKRRDGRIGLRGIWTDSGVRAQVKFLVLPYALFS